MLVRRALTAAGNPPDAALLDQALAAFRQCYRGRLFVASCLYPGVSETLPKLQVAGLTLGCVTNKPEGFARDLLDQAGISAYFDFVYGADSFATRKPSPEPLLKAAERFDISPRQSVMIGDSPNDLESARSAGFDFVYAAYGYGAPDDPALAACATVIESFSALHRLLCRS
jgi:phosphoglycolate phosphatase